MAQFVDGKRVSREWYVVLIGLRFLGVIFRLNSGRRRMSEQWALYRHYKRFGWPIAAFPSPWAPHIRVGRKDHANDINALDGGADRVDAACTKRGEPLLNTVAGEAWHKETANENSLMRLAKAVDIDSPYPIVTRGWGREAAVKEVQRHLRHWQRQKLGVTKERWLQDVTGKYGPRTRRRLRKFQRTHGLFVDGVVGPKTWRTLRRYRAK